MPHYYFDTGDGEVFVSDPDGMELENIGQARDEAMKALSDMARDRVPDGDRRDFVVVVKDETRQPVLRLTLALTVERLPR
jgi:hypothetical protein